MSKRLFSRLVDGFATVYALLFSPGITFIFKFPYRNVKPRLNSHLAINKLIHSNHMVTEIALPCANFKKETLKILLTFILKINSSLCAVDHT
ncbi:hypothetical protein DMS87_11720 [Klebsiella variicola]|nr:hypothetical protein [Klebsiella variicola]PXK36183.1 hypothetical protein DMR25_11560 [Klebsiella variicola]PXK79618.1 hypothetical protein DMS24_14620 [Klebsiella variicola]PXM09837.1 hypothetical protein DMT40_12680 [Klebsiella variicola]PXM50302.1 hypothetical protein DMS87_11720 [Klebsiella variicola]